jgi:glycosyltransferase involved in cell wall biosynthesis
MEQFLDPSDVRSEIEIANSGVVSLIPKDQPVRRTALRPLRVALIGNFAPRKCGIATFTTDLHDQLHAFHPEVAIDVYALQDGEDPVEHRDPVYEVERDDTSAYALAARQMNQDGVDAIWLQHEFGIFGGECGEDVLELTRRVAAPLVVTMHTVLADPNEKQEMIMRALIGRASRLMVMCKAARELLINRYQADAGRVAIVEHGAPDRALRLTTAKPAGSPVTLMTFGLLGPGKGLETAIEALPAIVARHPQTKYRIVGVEHPNELRRNGESYRRKLQDLAEANGVADHIEWVNRFLDTDELIDLIQDCDIYLTPYPNLQQSTSGTLSYAVALGRAVVSTPYVHARELLADTGGVLVDVGDPQAIAREVNRLLDDPEQLEALQLRTYRRGRATIWKCFAENSRGLLDAAIANDQRPHGASELVVPGLAAFDSLCDGTGMLQHGKFAIPDRNHGYCLDDNARALMLVHRVKWANAGEEYRRASTFASFVQHSWNDDLHQFRNFMNFDRTWCEDCGSEDSNGRGIWAIGDAVANTRLPALRTWALASFDRFAPMALTLGSPRAIGFTGLGAVAVLDRVPGHELALEIVQRSGTFLEKQLTAARQPGWAWFESVVGYDNARLPQALIECGRVTGNKAWIGAGLETLRWVLEQQTTSKGLFRPVGSDSFGRLGEILPFDQQPLEAWAAIDACASAYRVDPGNSAWIGHARRAYRWFLGENDRGVTLVDVQMGSCLDGVTPQGANLNVGAESLLAFQLAYYSYTDLLLRAGPEWREDAARRHTQRIG